MKRKAFAIVYTLLFILVLITIMAVFSGIAYNGLAMAKTAGDTTRAYYIAEAGLAKKFMDLRSGNASSTSGIFTIASGNSGTYSVAVAGAAPIYTLTATGTYRNAHKTVTLVVKQMSYARFSYLSNDEDNIFWNGTQPIWFTTGDDLKGPVYTNDRFNISGNPIFEGPVSSVGTAINYYHGGPPVDNPDFRDSLTLGAPVVQMPAFTNDVKTRAQQTGGVYLTGNSTVILLANGTMNVTNSAQHWTNHNIALPANDALFVSGGYVNISGILNGQLTVGTDNNIYVVNNILYHVDPNVDPTSTDLLGLVSQNNVYVDSLAPFNVMIDAYIIAMNTSFAVEDYDSALKGTLTINGGITQLRRGPVGTFDANLNQKVSGYTKNYNYDARLENMAPPYFPPATDTNGRILYIKTSWSES